jgi:predicted TPR repeat methyltransferase
MPPSDDNRTIPDEYHRAERAYRDGNLVEAEHWCRQALESVPEHGEALYLLGVIAFENVDDASAIDFLSRATQERPKHARAFFYLGAACHRLQNPSAALAAVLKAIALDPGLVEAHFQLGLVYQAQDELGEAEAAYRQGLKLDPDNARLHDALGTALHKAGRFEEAVTLYQQGLAIDPRLASLHNNLGSALQEQGELEAAGAAYLQSLLLAPERVETVYNLGFNLECRNQLDEAVAKYRHAIEINPRYVKAQLALARMCEARKEMQQAVDIYQRSIRLDPRNRAAHLGLGQILADVEKWAEARVCYENVLRIEADDVQANEGLGEVYRELGELDQAISYYGRARDLGSVAAGHLLAALTHEETPIAPRQYVEELFDSYSEDFEEHLLGTLSYQTPRILFETFTRYIGKSRRFQRAIDLGCGTGLLGLEFQSIVERIEGVDLSSDMLEKASEKGIYTDLNTGDIVEFLNAAGDKYDLFMAADVLIYIGNLSAVFLAVKDRATPGAYFVFSTESGDCREFELRTTGRYAHSEAYIRSLAQAQGFTMLRSTSVPLRKEGDDWIDGQIFILRYLPANEQNNTTPQ